MKLTKARIKAYIRRRGYGCPNCKSDNVIGESFSLEDGQAKQELFCHDCDCAWQDVYVLADVVELKCG